MTHSYQEIFGAILCIRNSTELGTRSCSTADEIRQQAVREGMKPLLADGLVKVALGRTTMDEVMLATGWLAEYAFG